MNPAPPLLKIQPSLDRDLQLLADNRARWVATPVAERMAILNEIKDALLPVAQAWAETAARKKGIAVGSPLEGEEWLSGPYTVMGYCNQMMATLSQVQGKRHLDHVPLRQLPNGQTVARVVPHSIWDHLLLSGVKVDVWIEQVDGGYVLQWDGGDPAYSGDMWYEDLDYAEHGAEEMFGIGPDDWE